MNKIIFSGRYGGKSMAMAMRLQQIIRLRPDKQIIIGCADQISMLREIQPFFPKSTLFELSSYGIKIFMRD